jgi:hypothetical protein
MLFEICSALHPEWAIEENVMLGLDGLKTICARLSTRLQNLNVGLNQHVSDLFTRALVGREMHHGYKLNWQLTAAEQRRVFVLLPLCLPNLITEECNKLNSHTNRPEEVPDVTDPSEEIIFCMGSTLSWYQKMRCRQMSQSDIDTVAGDSGALLTLWDTTFPSRDARLPKRLPQDGAFEKSATDNDDDQDTSSMSDSSSVSSSSSEDVSSSSSEDMSLSSVDHTATAKNVKKTAHQYPKAHAMMHAPASIELYGQWANCSAESMERKHVDIKDAAQQTNQRDGWLLQVLMRTKRESDISAKASQMRTGASTVSDQNGLNGHGHSVRDEQEELNTEGGVMTAASFGDTLHHSGLRMPIWTFIVQWAECMKVLDIRQPVLKIPWDSLSYAKSEVVVQCKAMMELPEAMAYYIQESFLSTSHMQTWSKIPVNGALSTQEMHELNKCIVPPPRHCKSRQWTSVEHILCFNVMTIKHPDILNCCIKLRAHPFR